MGVEVPGEMVTIVKETGGDAGGYKAGPEQAALKQVRQVAWSHAAAEDRRWTEKRGEIGPLEVTGDLSPLATGARLSESASSTQDVGANRGAGEREGEHSQNYSAVHSCWSVLSTLIQLKSFHTVAEFKAESEQQELHVCLDT